VYQSVTQTPKFILDDGVANEKDIKFNTIIMSTTTKQKSNNQPDIGRIQAECSAMIKTLKDLQKEEHDLQSQLDILAREAILCGYQRGVVEPSIRTRNTNRKKKGGEKDNEDDDDDEE
jgi:hypothetical protein